MPLESIICRRRLDEERGGEWVCECPLCKEMKKIKENEDRSIHGKLYDFDTSKFPKPGDKEWGSGGSEV